MIYEQQEETTEISDERLGKLNKLAHTLGQNIHVTQIPTFKSFVAYLVADGYVFSRAEAWYVYSLIKRLVQRSSATTYHEPPNSSEAPADPNADKERNE